MTTTDVVLGAALVLVVGRRLRATYLAQRHAAGPVTARDLARLAGDTAGAVSSSMPFGAAGAAGAALVPAPTEPQDDPTVTTGRTGRWLGLAARVGFVLWLYDVTDGAAFSPFGLAADALGGTVWPTVLVVVGLGEVVARVGGLAVRAVTERERARTRVSLRKV